ncbi:unnamed protein product, partial [Mycena citricolor]
LPCQDSEIGPRGRPYTTGENWLRPPFFSGPDGLATRFGKGGCSQKAVGLRPRSGLGPS